MREVLYRGFHENEIGKEQIQLDGKVIRGQWVKGQYLDGYICGKLAVADDENFMPEYWWKIVPETVCQYTGKTDKNGKMVWEGDILCANGSYDLTVVWYSEEARFWANIVGAKSGHKDDDDSDFAFASDFCRYEVIGNKWKVKKC